MSTEEQGTAGNGPNRLTDILQLQQASGFRLAEAVIAMQAYSASIAKAFEPFLRTIAELESELESEWPGVPDEVAYQTAWESTTSLIEHGRSVLEEEGPRGIVALESIERSLEAQIEAAQRGQEGLESEDPMYRRLDMYESAYRMQLKALRRLKRRYMLDFRVPEAHDVAPIPEKTREAACIAVRFLESNSSVESLCAKVAQETRFSPAWAHKWLCKENPRYDSKGETVEERFSRLKRAVLEICGT